jgi:hypothetical protein
MLRNTAKLLSNPRIFDRSESNFELASAIRKVTPSGHAYRECLDQLAILVCTDLFHPKFGPY